MTTINGSITSANPGADLYTAIETAMTGIGWTLVDTVVIGSNTHKVLKSAAAGNTQNLDWYLDINFPTTGITGGIRFAAFEGYNSSTHVGINGPFEPGSTTTTIDATTYSRFGSTGSALETNWANSASYTGLSSPLVTSAFNYRISVTRNRIIAMLTNNAGQIAYAGFFTPSSAHASWAGSALFPLVTAMLAPANANSYSNATGGTASLTRMPKVTTLTGLGWAYHVSIPTNTTYIGTQPEGQIGVAVSPFTGRSSIVPLHVWASAAGSSSMTPANSTPHLDEIGTIDDVALGYIVSSSIRDDTITVGSDTWYDVSPNSTATMFFRGI